MAKKDLPYADFAKRIGGHSLLPDAPKNKRPFVQMVITEFERDGVMFSNSGMSINVLAWYALEQSWPVTIEMRPGYGWSIRKGLIRGDHLLDNAFAREMHGKQYGEQETRDAYDWFKAGWKARNTG